MDMIFNSKLISILQGSSIAAAKELMATHRIRHLPIVNNQNEIISIISKHDMMYAEKFQDLPVDLFASFPVQYVTAETPLSTVALKMLEQKISSVILCDSSKFAIGIITTDDLLFQFSLMAKEIEKAGADEEVKKFNLLNGAGEFFQKLSNIGI